MTKSKIADLNQFSQKYDKAKPSFKKNTLKKDYSESSDRQDHLEYEDGGESNEERSVVDDDQNNDVNNENGQSLCGTVVCESDAALLAQTLGFEVRQAEICVSGWRAE